MSQRDWNTIIPAAGIIVIGGLVVVSMLIGFAGSYAR